MLNEVSHYYSKQHIRTHPEALLRNYLLIEISDRLLTQATKNFDLSLNIIGAIKEGALTGLVKAIFTETLLSKYGTPLIESYQRNILIAYEHFDLPSFFFEELQQPQRQHLL